MKSMVVSVPGLAHCFKSFKANDCRQLELHTWPACGTQSRDWNLMRSYMPCLRRPVNAGLIDSLGSFKPYAQAKWTWKERKRLILNPREHLSLRGCQEEKEVSLSMEEVGRGVPDPSELC
eukprot:1160996-Pelagomonas_calceolata.AAC.7